VPRVDHFQHAGFTFDVTDSGPDGAEAVVLLHGFPQDATSWSRVVPALQAAGLRTLAPDQRGYSPGVRPRSRRAYATRDLTADIIALLDQAGLESAHIVGHDWGGAVAWSLAGDHPDRVRSLTVLSTPHPSAMLKAMRTGTQAFRSWYMVAFQVPWIPEHLVPLGIVPALQRSGLSRASAEHYAQRMREPGALRGAINWYRGLPLSLRTPSHRSPVPSTYIWGRDDEFLGRKGAELTRNFVLGPYQFLELDGGHWLPETHADQVAGAILSQIRAVAT
jgi:pimeloyl-ACP methyl ester carboxylesterase